MKLTNKNMKNYLKKNLSVSCNDLKIKETVLKSKKAYYENQENSFLSRAEFLYQQSKYIHKRWWIVQGLLLFVLWLILKYTESSFTIQRSIGIAAPLFVILIMPEIWKNRNTNAMEVEGTAYYSLRQIYAARMILFALVDLVLLSLFFAAASNTVKFTAGELLIQFFVPFNVTCCICFRTLYSKKAGSEVFALLLCMVWIAVWVQIVLSDMVYGVISAPVWIAMISLSFLYVGFSIRKGQKQCLESWEVKPLWN